MLPIGVIFGVFLCFWFVCLYCVVFVDKKIVFFVIYWDKVSIYPVCEFYSFSVLWLRRRCAKKVKEKDVLIPGKVSEFVFPLLMELSSVRSERVIYALRDFLVWGYTRKEVCERYGVTYSYFSKALKRVCRVGNIIVCLLEHYPFIH